MITVIGPKNNMLASFEETTVVGYVATHFMNNMSSSLSSRYHPWPPQSVPKISKHTEFTASSSKKWGGVGWGRGEEGTCTGGWCCSPRFRRWRKTRCWQRRWSIHINIFSLLDWRILGNVWFLTVEYGRSNFFFLSLICPFIWMTITPRSSRLVDDDWVIVYCIWRLDCLSVEMILWISWSRLSSSPWSIFLIITELVIVTLLLCDYDDFCIRYCETKQ